MEKYNKDDIKTTVNKIIGKGLTSSKYNDAISKTSHAMNKSKEIESDMQK